LRAIPNLLLFRPADAAETAVGWCIALENKHGPTALALTRQSVPTLDRSRYAAAEGARRGAYVVSDADHPRIILIGTGSELQLALQAQEQLAGRNVAARVVSMPSWQLFAAQTAEYQATVLPPDIPARVSVEAGVTLGWERYIGREGIAIGLDHFGASAPYEVIYENFGLTAEAVVAAALRLIKP
jgi:transketolase